MQILKSVFGKTQTIFFLSFLNYYNLIHFPFFKTFCLLCSVKGFLYYIMVKTHRILELQNFLKALWKTMLSYYLNVNVSLFTLRLKFLLKYREFSYCLYNTLCINTSKSMFFKISDLNRLFNPQGQVNIVYTLKVKWKSVFYYSYLKWHTKPSFEMLNSPRI